MEQVKDTVVTGQGQDRGPREAWLRRKEKQSRTENEQNGEG